MPDPRPVTLSLALILTGLAAGCGSPKPATPAYALPGRAPDPRPREEEPADVEEQPVGPLTLDAAVARAVERSGEVSALRWSAYAARQQVYVDVQYDEPQLRARYGEDELTETGVQSDLDGLESPSDVSRSQDGQAFGLGLRFYPRNPLVAHWMKQEGHTAARAAEELVREAQWRIATEVRRLFVYVRFLEQDCALIERHQDNCAKLLEHARVRSGLGEMIEQDIYRLMRRCVETDGAAARLRRELTVNRRELAALVDVPPGELELAPLHPDLGRSLVDVDNDRLLDRAFANRPDLAVLVYTTDAARHSVSSSRSRRMPWIEHIQASYGEAEADERSGSQGALGGGDETRTELEQEEWRIDAALSLPLFAWTSKQPRQAKALLEAALQYEMNLKRAIEGEVIAAAEDARFLEADSLAGLEEGEGLLAGARALAGLLEQGVVGASEELFELEEDILRIERVHLRRAYDTQLARMRLLEVLGVIDGDGA